MHPPLAIMWTGVVHQKNKLMHHFGLLQPEQLDSNWNNGVPVPQNFDEMTMCEGFSGSLRHLTQF